MSQPNGKLSLINNIGATEVGRTKLEIPSEYLIKSIYIYIYINIYIPNGYIYIYIRDRGTISVNDVKEVLQAQLDFPVGEIELNELMNDLDPNQTGLVTFDSFLKVYN